MRLAVFLAVALVGGGCGSSPSTALPAKTPVQAGNPSPSAPPDDSSLSRSTIKAVVSEGLGSFLRFVELDDHPVVVDGKFYGFRIVALHGPVFSSAIDLRPGDVVTAINGLPIERPEQAEAAFESLVVAQELRVAYDRDGKARELVLPIAEDR